MPYYKLCFHENGSAPHSVEFDYASDEEALAALASRRDQGPLELWRGQRLIARIGPADENSLEQFERGPPDQRGGPGAEAGAS